VARFSTAPVPIAPRWARRLARSSGVAAAAARVAVTVVWGCPAGDAVPDRPLVASGPSRWGRRWFRYLVVWRWLVHGRHSLACWWCWGVGLSGSFYLSDVFLSLATNLLSCVAFAVMPRVELHRGRGNTGTPVTACAWGIREADGVPPSGSRNAGFLGVVTRVCLGGIVCLVAGQS
jgi:hypothetical protein